MIFLTSDKIYFEANGIERRRRYLSLYMLHLKYLLYLQIEMLRSHPNIRVQNLWQKLVQELGSDLSFYISIQKVFTALGPAEVSQVETLSVQKKSNDRVVEYWLLKKDETNEVKLSKFHVNQHLEYEFIPSVINISTQAIFNTLFRLAFGGQFNISGSSAYAMWRLGFFLSLLPGPTVSRMLGMYTVLRISVLPVPKCSHSWTLSSSESISTLSTYPFSHMSWKGCLSYVSCFKAMHKYQVGMNISTPKPHLCHM